MFLILNRNFHYSLKDSYRLTSVLIDIFISPDPSTLQNGTMERKKVKIEMNNGTHDIMSHCIFDLKIPNLKNLAPFVANSLWFFSLEIC